MDPVVERHIRELVAIENKQTDSLIARFIAAYPDVPLDEVVLVKQLDGATTRFWVERRK